MIFRLAFQVVEDTGLVESFHEIPVIDLAMPDRIRETMRLCIRERFVANIEISKQAVISLLLLLFLLLLLLVFCGDGGSRRKLETVAALFLTCARNELIKNYYSVN